MLPNIKKNVIKKMDETVFFWRPFHPTPHKAGSVRPARSELPRWASARRILALGTKGTARKGAYSGTTGTPKGRKTAANSVEGGNPQESLGVGHGVLWLSFFLSFWGGDGGSHLFLYFLFFPFFWGVAREGRTELGQLADLNSWRMGNSPSDFPLKIKNKDMVQQHKLNSMPSSQVSS